MNSIVPLSTTVLPWPVEFYCTICFEVVWYVFSLVLWYDVLTQRYTTRVQQLQAGPKFEQMRPGKTSGKPSSPHPKYYWLVVSTHLKNMKVSESLGMIIPNMWENKHVPVTSNQMTFPTPSPTRDDDLNVVPTVAAGSAGNVKRVVGRNPSQGNPKIIMAQWKSMVMDWWPSPKSNNIICICIYIYIYIHIIDDMCT